MLFPELCQGPCLLEAPDLPGQAMLCNPARQANMHCKHCLCGALNHFPLSR